MSNRNYQYLHPDFSPEQTEKYTLLVKADNTTFSFAIADKNKLLVLTEKHTIGELDSVVDENDFLFKSYKKSVVGLVGNAFTFVPASLFDPGKVTDFARFLDVKATEKVFSQSFDTDNQVIFTVGGPLLSLANKFDPKNVVFAPKGWITAIAGSGPSNNDMFLNITGETVEILNVKNNKLRFYNTFEFQNEDELVYFTSFISGELQLAPESITLILSGEIETGDKNYSRLTEFFHKVDLNNTKVIAMPAQFPSYSSLALTALTLCGSSGAY